MPDRKQVIEYGDIRNGDLVTRAPLADGYIKHPSGRITAIWTERVTAGYECAGSAARWTEPYVRTAFYSVEGGIHGRRFPDTLEGMDRASAMFSKLRTHDGNGDAVSD